MFETCLPSCRKHGRGWRRSLHEVDYFLARSLAIVCDVSSEVHSIIWILFYSN